MSRFRMQITQRWNAALRRARTEGNQLRRFLAKQTSHLLVFRGSYGAVEQGDGKTSVRKSLDVACLCVQQAWAKHEIEMRIHREQPFVKIDQRNLASSAGGCPVHRQLRLT